MGHHLVVIIFSSCEIFTIQMILCQELLGRPQMPLDAFINEKFLCGAQEGQEGTGGLLRRLGGLKQGWVEMMIIREDDGKLSYLWDMENKKMENGDSLGDSINLDRWHCHLTAQVF